MELKLARVRSQGPVFPMELKLERVRSQGPHPKGLTTRHEALELPWAKLICFLVAEISRSQL
jgi:hypothetical protein